GVQAPFTVCIDDVYLSDPQFTPSEKAAERALPNVRVNQVGYFPGARKLATVVNPSTEPLDWELLQEGKAVQTGKTTPVGVDADSGDSVHLIDFTKVRTAGTGYVLRVGDDHSPAFEIGPK